MPYVQPGRDRRGRAGLQARRPCARSLHNRRRDGAALGLGYKLCSSVEMGHEGTKYVRTSAPTVTAPFSLCQTLFDASDSGYMVKKLLVDKSISMELCILDYKQYGMTMAGLQAVGYQLHYDDFHVHDFFHGRLAYKKLYGASCAVPPLVTCSYPDRNGLLHANVPGLCLCHAHRFMQLLTNWLSTGPDYMVEKLRGDKSVSLELCVLNYNHYGNTMTGLQAA